ncbi:small ribosomal subunit protein mS86 (rPPR1)-like [Rosa rugosa]|uniref:small ribosomal subunit protein mS86 (rPPR1)-like n=1 Tax=Rosa rugosa TaxID=74645 RepID=UPI002B401EF3|nr:small ribosomal subunit protein mS86 (rPPR1)-like [Rosa rugosa]
MSLISRLRQSFLLLHTRRLSTTTEPSSRDKIRSLIALLKTEKDPHKIVSLCQSASLTPDSNLHRIALTRAVTSLRDSPHPNLIPQFLDHLLLSRPDLQTHRIASHVILLYGRARMPDHAVRTFELCHELGIPQDVKLLNALLLSCVFAEDYKEVTRIYRDFPKVYGIQPNLDTYNCVLKSLSESGSTGSAYSVLAEMERRRIKPDGNTFGHLLSGFYSEERFEDVGNVINLMEKYGFQPGLDTYNVRVRSLCKLKKSMEAEALLDGMLGRGIKPNAVTFCHLILGFCKEGNLEKGKKMFEKMVERGFKPDCNCYYTLVYYSCTGGDFESALRFAKESIEKNWVPNFATMRLLVDGLVSIGKVAEARQLIGQMKEKFTVNQHRWSEVEEGLPQ